MEYYVAVKKDEDIISGMICTDLRDILRGKIGYLTVHIYFM